MLGNGHVLDIQVSGMPMILFPKVCLTFLREKEEDYGKSRCLLTRKDI